MARNQATALQHEQTALSASTSNLAGQTQSLDAQLRDAESRLKDRETAIFTLTAAQKRLTEGVAGQQSQIERLRTQLAESEQSHTSAHANAEAAQAETVKMRQGEDRLQLELAKQNEMCRLLETKLGKIASEHGSAVERATELEARVVALTSKQASTEREMMAAKQAQQVGSELVNSDESTSTVLDRNILSPDCVSR